MSVRGGRASHVERSAQNLPVPIGGTAPVHLSRRGRHLTWPAIDALASAAGLGAAVTGLALLGAPRVTAVAMVDQRVTVGAISLTETGAVGGTGQVAYGGAVSYVLRRGTDGSAVAAAAWNAPGGMSDGVCHMSAPGPTVTDRCVFHAPGTLLTSVDVLQRGSRATWQRTYDDGFRVTIAISPGGAAIPMPFPIDH